MAFNGATAFRRWKRGSRAGNQGFWSAFNGATAFRRWKRLGQPGPFPAALAFNGATAFRRWKPAIAATEFYTPSGLQWSHRLSALETITLRFNGRTISFDLQWSHRLSALETGEPHQRAVDLCGPSMEPPPFGAGNGFERPFRWLRGPAFNGATAFRRWKHWAHWAGALPAAVLQWSHRLSALETVKKCHKFPSMACLQWSHRLSALETWPRPRVSTGQTPAFNGATAFRRWKHVGRCPGGLFRLEPSMEPPPFGAGNQEAEARQVLDLEPSMEPPPFGAGNALPGVRGEALQTLPSMEPPPFGAGNVAKAICARCWAICLQWSHRLSALETFLCPPCAASESRLQWSHRLSALETLGPLSPKAVRTSLQWSHRLSALETGQALK